MKMGILHPTRHESRKSAAAIFITFIIIVMMVGVWNTPGYSAELTVSDSITTLDNAVINGKFIIPLFDPSLGTLKKVIFSLDGMVDLQFSFSNTTHNFGWVTRGLGAIISLKSPFAPLVANPNTRDIALIVGPRETNGATVSDSETASEFVGKTISDDSLLAELTGFGIGEIGVNIGLDIHGTISPYFPNETITGNMHSSNFVEAILELVYVYEPVKPLPEIVSGPFSGTRNP